MERNKIYNSQKLSINYSSLLSTVIALGNIVVLTRGFILVINSQITLGTLMIFTSLLSYFMEPITDILQMQIDIQLSILAAERLDDVVEATEEKSLYYGEVDIKQFEKKIKFQNVTFAYGFNDPILDGINLTINKGEKVALIGKSGCGKSSLAKLISAIYPVNQGDIYIDNFNIKKISLHSLRKIISYVPHDCYLFSGSIKDNIMLGLNDLSITGDRLEEVIIGCKLDEVINSLPNGIDSSVSESGRNFSAGQKQRMAIARALLSEPDILILDESTNNLDKETEKEIIAYISANYVNMTCVFILHSQTLLNECTRIIKIENGKVLDA